MSAAKPLAATFKDANDDCTEQDEVCLCQSNMAEEVSALLSGLAHKERLMVVALLLDSREMHVNEMVEQLGVNRTALSRHLARLREMSVVSTRRDHNRIFYSLSHNKAARVIGALGLANA